MPGKLGFGFHLRVGRLHMTTTMQGQDVWIGMPYGLFFCTVLHELVAGRLGVKLGEFHHHAGSLHIYGSHLDQNAQLTALTASEIMPELRTPWEGFDELLRRVQSRELTGHRGWDAMSETMRSYRFGRRRGRRRLQLPTRPYLFESAAALRLACRRRPVLGREVPELLDSLLVGSA